MLDIHQKLSEYDKVNENGRTSDSCFTVFYRSLVMNIQGAFHERGSSVGSPVCWSNDSLNIRELMRFKT